MRTLEESSVQGEMARRHTNIMVTVPCLGTSWDAPRFPVFTKRKEVLKEAEDSICPRA